MSFDVLKRWHGRTGVIAALFVLILALTGLCLNHVSSWGLDRKALRSPALLALYGMTEVETVKSYPLAETYISQINNRLFYEHDEIAGCEGGLVGVAAIALQVVVACELELLVFSPDFELIEKIGPAQGLPKMLMQLGLVQGRLLIDTAEDFLFVDLDSLTWTAVAQDINSLPVQWSVASSTPENLRLILAQAHGGEGITYERLLLDIHSGRILGEWGIYLVDAMAMLFMLLAISGLVIWVKGKKA